MSSAETVDSTRREALLEHAIRLKHDLGKYICFQQRWLSSEASDAERVEALRADLLHTRRGPSGSVNALEVWAEFDTLLLSELDADPDVLTIAAEMSALSQVLLGLESGQVDIPAAERSCLTVSSAIRSLVQRLRS